MPKARRTKVTTTAPSLDELSNLILYPEIILASQPNCEDEIKTLRNLNSHFKAGRVKFEKLAKLSSTDSLKYIQSLADRYKQHKITRSSQTYNIDCASIIEVLNRLNPAIKLINTTLCYFVVVAPNLKYLPPLPRGYGFKGGAARAALAKLIRQSSYQIKPRDLDLIKAGNGKPEIDHHLTSKFMTDDCKHGAQIEQIRNISDYFSSRDLTINQIVLINDLIFCSYQALQDMLNHVLRTTPFVVEKNGFPQGRITVKILRLKAESQGVGRPFQIIDSRHNPNVKLFDIALHLERALQRDQATAQRYLAKCIQHGYLKLTSSNIEQAISVLRNNVPGRLNQFTLLKKRKNTLSTKRQIGLIRAIR